MNPLHIALFADSFHEVNGAAHTLRQYQTFARHRGLPLLAVHSGHETRCFHQGSVTTLELRRSRAAIAVDVDFGFDPLLWLEWRRIGEALAAFKADLVHIISPGDFGILGACWAYRLGIPIVGSYHTNLHEFAAARLQNTLRFVPAGPRQAICQFVERACALGLAKYYQIPRLVLAPNPELQRWLERATGRPCRLMRRGVDIELFCPSRRDRQDGIFRLGYVGRLMREKNVRLLVEIERALIDSGVSDYQFVIVGQGDERAWLEQNLLRAEFTGVLHGEDLARAYANMDLFVFPSRTDAFGNVVQEALAAGTPALVTSQGGPKFLVNPGVTGYVAENDRDFIARALLLARDREKLPRMRLAARQAACGASWDRVFEEVWESYEICLRRRGRQVRLIREKPAESDNVAEATAKLTLPSAPA
jgi:glycosyltransferase involved in cell wall biosynthesis